MERIRREARVPAEKAGMRVDRVAAELFADYSRALLSKWIQEGALRVDDATVKPKARLLGGERLRLDATLEAREDWGTAEPVAFRVVYEDDTLLVIDKPAGLVVHPGAGNPRGTLVNGLLSYRPGLAHLPRAGIIHRLDKDTSGLLLVAATASAQHVLGKMLGRREVSRRYLALVEGQLVGGMDIDKPLGRDPHRRTRQAVRDDGRQALTRVRVLARYRAHTLVEATLETGRTHQIRVHLASAGYPLVGDGRYGARGRLPPQPDQTTVEVLRAFRRQALHAWKLGLLHPLTGEALSFQAEPPEDLRRLMEILEADVHQHDD
ncbi:MAG: 23S rRNA pseudouridine(1911/1915/1917) synthase RluD [Pseudomonadales bacterium]